METRTPSLRLLVLPVAFGLVCVVLTLLVFHVFGGRLPLEAKGYRFTMPLPQASNLVTGSDVQIAGVKIGEVTDVERRGNGAQATLEIKPAFVPIRTGARAIARTKTLLGEGYVELAPGPRRAAPIPDGGTMAASQVQPNVQLDEFLQTFGPDTRRRMHELFAGVATAFAGRSEAFNDALGSSAPLAGSVDQILGVVDAQRADLGALVSSSAGILNAIGERQGLLQAAVRAGDDVLDVTARERRGLRATVRALPPFLKQLQATSRTITAASPDLNAGVAALQPVAPKVRPALEQIDAAAPEFTALLRALPKTIAAGKQGLPALSSMIGATRSAFAEFYPTARELIPIVQLMAANPTAPEAPFADVAALTNGIFVGPGGLVQHYAKGLPTVWNETIGGWVKRLPTNILNPYVKPGGQADIAKLGHIKAFDCRNVKNPPYVPSTGTGSPPCDLQGPWEFNGKSAFYPRLELAPK
jgi:phospholipid/cholesterol/gamma-HCH transport system substrate-binding protein